MTDSTSSTKPSEAVQASRALLKELQEKHSVFRDCLPLAIGIDKQLLASYPNLERKVLRTALRYHTSSLRYLKAVEKTPSRSNLDGSTAEEIPDAHRIHAAKLVHERLQRDAERRKNQRASAAAEAAERQRAEKLEQLAAKFAKK